MFDFFQPFVDRYFFIQRSFSLDFYAKNGSVFGWENIRKHQINKYLFFNSKTPEDAWNAWRLKIVYEQKACFRRCFG